MNLARDLANTPPAEKSPARLADRIRLVAEDAGLAVEVWDEKRIEQERFGGLMGVAAGSHEPPRFVVLRHAQGGDAPTLALVGKGVTFDSGGLSLKPSASMEDMKVDMTGAAVVAAAMQAVARLGLPVNLVGYLPLTENMTGGRAMKLGDVLTMRNGKTVEVLNTDAEGRLILADALSYAVEQKPARLIDLATLTGACMVALGTRIAGLFGNDDAFCRGPPRRRPPDRRARLAAAARRRLQGGPQEPGRRHEEHRRQVGRGGHRGQVPRAVRRDRRRGSTWTSPARAGPNPTAPPAMRVPPAASSGRLSASSRHSVVISH